MKYFRFRSRIAQKMAKKFTQNYLATRTLELRHFCVGPYNTVDADHETRKTDRHIRYTC